MPINNIRDIQDGIVVTANNVQNAPKLEFQITNAVALALIRTEKAASGGGRLSFETNNGTSASMRMLIDQQGNVSIKEANPRATFHVGGDAIFTGPLNIGGTPSEENDFLTVAGNAKVGGRVAAANFTGDGTALTNITPKNDSVNSDKLRADGASLSKVSGGKMVVNGNNVGIGTTTPQAMLHVEGDAKVKNLTVSGTLMGVNLTPGPDSIKSAQLLQDPASLSKVSGGKMVVDGNNVGIGTTSPQAMLHVEGDARVKNLTVSGTLMGVNLTPGPDSIKSAQLLQDSASLSKVSGGKMVVDGDNVGIGTTSPQAMLHVEGDAKVKNLTVSGTLMGVNLTPGPDSIKNAQLLQDSASLSKVSGGKMVVNGNNVGIGTTTPQAMLHVEGDAKVNGSLLLENMKIGTRGEPTGHCGLKSAGESAVIRLYRTNDANAVEIAHRTHETGGYLNLSVPGGAGSILVMKYGSVNIGNRIPHENFKLDVDGDVRADSVHESSDARLKKNVVQASGVLDKLRKIRGVFFEWNEKYLAHARSAQQRKIGVIAQEIEAVFPELVVNSDYKTVNYSGLVAVLVEATKELLDMNESINLRVTELEKRQS